MRTHVVAPPNGCAIRAANTAAVSRARAVARRCPQGAEVVNTILDLILPGKLVGAAVHVALLHLGVLAHGSGLGNRGELEIRVELEDLRVDFLDRAVEDFGLAGGNFDIPFQNVDAVSGDGRLGTNYL